MTKFCEKSRVCFLCGESSTHREILSTRQLRAPYLDTRPMEFAKWVLSAIVQECPHCGYVGGRLSDSTGVGREFLRSEEYQGCCGIGFKDPLARRFFRLYLVKKSDGDARNAFWSALQAGWVCDDVMDWESGFAARVHAAEELAKVIEERPSEENWKCVMLDVLRRSRRFEEAIAFYSSISLTAPLHREVAAFEYELALKKDFEPYTLDRLPRASTSSEPRAEG